MPAECSDDAMLIFDASGSMAEMGYNGLNYPRIHDAREALHRALPQVEPFRRLGLVIYGPGDKTPCANVSLRLRPTKNASSLIMEQVEEVVPEGNTPLTKSVEVAAEVLDFRNKSGVIVVVTDGRETCNGFPCQLASKLTRVAAGLTVHIIGFRVRGEFFQWQSQNADEPVTGVTVARCLADRTGGLYVSTETVDELVVALQQTLGCSVIGRSNPESSNPAKLG